MSIDGKPDPFKKEKPRGKSESQQDHPSRSEGGKVLERQMNLISKIFGVHLSVDQEEQTRFAIALLSTNLKDAKPAKSPTLDKVMAEIDKRTEESAVWKKTIIKKGVTMAWMVARKLSPQFSNAEEVLDGILTKDVRKVAAGTLRFFVPGTGAAVNGVHWILEEISVDRQTNSSQDGETLGSVFGQGKVQAKTG